MSYDIEDFEVGDEIKYISKCYDHETAENITDGNFMVGGYYKVVGINRIDDQVLLDAGSDLDDNILEWWVDIRHVIPTKEIEVKGKYWKVIRKIKQMDRVRKEKGYAF